MGIFQNIKKALNYVNPDTAFERKERAPERTVTDNTKNRTGLLYRLNRSYKYAVKLGMQQYRDALEYAENPLRPDRRMLYAIYDKVKRDDQVVAQERTAIATVKNAPFVVEVSGTESEETKADVFEKRWFRQFLKIMVETEMWGHTLVEFVWRGKDLHDCVAVPREHVRPEYGDVIVNTTDIVGIPFRPEMLPDCLEFGEPDALGLYNILTTPVTRKTYSDTDWSVYSEKYGTPLLSIKTQSRQKNEIEEKENMAANFGANGYVILDDQDEIEIIERKGSGDSYQIFLERINLSDNKISKIINGQTGTSDEKAFVGSAEVHERTLNEFTLARLTDIQSCINEQLIPYLSKKGMLPKNTKFTFEELTKKEIEVQTDPTEAKNEKNDAGSKKKRLSYPY